MPLAPGVRFGVYEITALIGAGSMGQVWRAMDTTLGRQVAIKVLPDAFATDPDRVMRFEREAKTLATLNHPHIAAIYGFEKSGAVHGLVMELVAGDDLSLRIAGGAIPLDEALPIAKQIAEALEAAHEQGIVHRDLKPANVKIRADGTAKVLDFGLAKALDPGDHAPEGSLADSPTITSPAMTMRGVILGTAAYMSPEQAAGRPVDKRSDLWAFGVVMLEMLTGRPVFTGESVSHVLASVLKSDPDWSRLPAETPPAIRRLLRRCLEKDRKRRIADASDVRLEIEDAMVRTPPGEEPTAIGAVSASPRRSARWTTGALALSAAVIAAMAIPTVRYLRQGPPSMPAETRTDILTPAGNPASFALSPDGRHIVYVATSDGAPRLWLRSLTTTASQPLAGTEGADYPFWSPDSRSIGFFAGGALKRLDIGAGPPLTLAPAPSGRGATWSPSGVILVAPNTTGPLMRVPIAGGDLTAVTTPGQDQSGHRWPVALPDGRRFIFSAGGALHLGALDESPPVLLTASDGSGMYLSARPNADVPDENGWLLWPSGDNLMARRLDLARGALTGDPVIIANNVAVNASALTAVSASATGEVAYRVRGGVIKQLTWVDRAGENLGTLGYPGPHEAQHPAVSPDGQRVAVSRTVQNNTDVWLLEGDRTRRLTFDAGVDQMPIWSPDGSRVAFMSNRKGQFDLYEKLASGVGSDVPIVTSNQRKTPRSWSADGVFLLYSSVDPQSGDDLWVVRMKPGKGQGADEGTEPASARAPSVFLKTRYREEAAVFSPDGRWVAYTSNESGRYEVYVTPFVDPASPGVSRVAGQWQMSSGGGVYPRWRRDGKELYYLNQAGDVMAATVALKGATLDVGAPVRLFQRRVFAVLDGTPDFEYDVAPDGRFLVNTVIDSGLAPITLLMNWRR
jgi:serine/threonine protein kinase/Tol biopolymer transport system component